MCYDRSLEELLEMDDDRAGYSMQMEIEVGGRQVYLSFIEDNIGNGLTVALKHTAYPGCPTAGRATGDVDSPMMTEIAVQIANLYRTLMVHCGAFIEDGTVPPSFTKEN